MRVEDNVLTQEHPALVADDQEAGDADGDKGSNDSHERWDAQGRSLSNADGSRSGDDSDSDEDHLANACPAIDHSDNWAEWEDTVEEFRRSLPKSVAAAAACTLDRGQADIVEKHMNKHLAPAMPTIDPDRRPHREKLKDRQLVVNLMVARPVGRNEISDNPDAKAAMQKEWAALKQQKVWNLLIVREKSEVIAEARKQEKEVQFGRVHGICVEKNFELPEGHASQKYKGRVVFLGNQVKNQDFEQATFMDMGNSPATIESARLCDFYGCFKGHMVSVADAVQAYIQAELGGNICWINLPREAWPEREDGTGV